MMMPWLGNLPYKFPFVFVRKVPVDVFARVPSYTVRRVRINSSENQDGLSVEDEEG